MLAGFLAEINEKNSKYSISCCIPYNLDVVKARFPSVNWFPYTPDAREACIKDCDVWLGLGGSPFQNSVSSWFIDHLTEEHRLISKFHKPMAFLGIGSQDDDAFNNKNLYNIIKSSNYISVRDSHTYKTLIERDLPNSKLSLGADLGHLFFSRNLPSPALKGRLSVILNSDYKPWPNLNSVIENLDKLDLDEKIWLIQESRFLPGSELQLYESLKPEIRSKWKPMFAEQSNQRLSSILAAWQTGEWTLTSRYHSALASLWGGSKTTIFTLNHKLSSVADDFGLNTVPMDASHETILASLKTSKPVDKGILATHTARAKAAVEQFCTIFDI